MNCDRPALDLTQTLLVGFSPISLSCAILFDPLEFRDEAWYNGPISCYHGELHWYGHKCQKILCTQPSTQQVGPYKSLIYTDAV